MVYSSWPWGLLGAGGYIWQRERVRGSGKWERKRRVGVGYGIICTAAVNAEKLQCIGIKNDFHEKKKSTSIVQ